MLTTHKATVADAKLIADHRYAMFAEMGNSDPSTLEQMRTNFMPWVERAIAAGKYVGWLVRDEGKVAASAGFYEVEWPPHRLDPAGERRGYLLNFWVEPPYRRRGLARGLVKEALAESRRRGIRVTALHASDAGRLVYEQMGFKRPMRCTMSKKQSLDPTGERQHRRTNQGVFPASALSFRESS